MAAPSAGVTTMSEFTQEFGWCRPPMDRRTSAPWQRLATQTRCTSSPWSTAPQSTWFFVWQLFNGKTLQCKCVSFPFCTFSSDLKFIWCAEVKYQTNDCRIIALFVLIFVLNSVNVFWGTIQNIEQYLMFSHGPIDFLWIIWKQRFVMKFYRKKIIQLIFDTYTFFFKNPVIACVKCNQLKFVSEFLSKYFIFTSH